MPGGVAGERPIWAAPYAYWRLTRKSSTSANDAPIGEGFSLTLSEMPALAYASALKITHTNS